MFVSRYLIAFFLLGLSRISTAAPTQHPFLASSTSARSSDGRAALPTRLEEATISILRDGLESGSYTSFDLTSAYLERMSVLEDVHAMVLVSPYALRDASAADSLRSQLGSPERAREHHPLLGIPFVVKDNIAIPARIGETTAGSYALLNSTVRAAAPVVQRLLNAGAILLGTTNLDEFAQAKGDHPWGWSARGGQMRSIYGRETSSDDVALAEGYGDVCGSSGGSALSVALGLSAFALGTQTGVSIVCPSGRAGIVGFKPGHGGMMPMSGVIPISKHLDVVGPIARSVDDAELIWRIIKHPRGWEGNDAAAAAVDYLRPKRRVRIGVPKNVFQSRLIEEDSMPEIPAAISKLVSTLSNDPRLEIFTKEVINITSMAHNKTYDAIGVITSHELKQGIDHYLSNWTLSQPSSPRTLADIIRYNKDNPSLELPPGPFPAFGHEPREGEAYADQSFLLKAESIVVTGWANETYKHAREYVERVGWLEGFGPYFSPAQDGVDVMLVPTEGVSGTMASLSGVPQITIPLGYMSSSTRILSNDTHPLYPYPDMPYGVSLLAARGHDNHELLLHVAKIVESHLSRDSRSGERRDRMRQSVRRRLWQ